MLIRPGYNFNRAGKTTVLKSKGAGAAFNFDLVLGRHSLMLHTGTNPAFPDAVRPGEDIIAKFKGIGVTSPLYLHDNKWHHLAFRSKFVSSSTDTNSSCFVDIYVDGQSPQAFKSNSTSKLCTIFQSGENITFLSDSFDGDIDEVAIYETSLPDSLIYAHYTDAILNHKPYRLIDPGTPAPAPAPTSSTFSLKEFAPGTQLPTPTGKPTQGVKLSCLQQLQQYPNPRYPSTTSIASSKRKLGPLSNCMDPQYMADENQPNTTKMGVINGSLAIQRELATTWNYAIFIGNVNELEFKHNSSYINLTMELVNEMHAKHQTPFELEIIRANVYNISMPRGPNNKPAIVSNNHPDACYLQDKSGNFIDYHGLPVKNASRHRYLRITSKHSTVCPDATFDSDGEYFKSAFTSLQRNLSKSVRAIRLWEDGELFASQMSARDALALDPVVFQDFLSLKLPNTSIGYDFRTFTSNWRLRLTNRFRDIFMQDNALKQQLLADTEYGEFEVEGSTTYFGRWPILRNIMTARPNPRDTSKTMHYAKVDMYVTRPFEWDIGAGSWHGLDWISMVLPSQIAAGDFLYSPFVSPGWSAAEEKNVRPGQWLGLLKCAAATGAEYYYTGLFSPSDNGLFSRSQNWAWVAAIPAYAQAITQQWVDLLDNGKLLQGDQPMQEVMWNLPSDILQPISYRFWSGSQNVPVYIRQSLNDPSVLLVTGTVQPQSSVVGNVPLVVNASIQLPLPAKQNQLTVFEFRRQGSVYVVHLDKGATDVVDAAEVSSVVQLDAWHEATHPSYWNSNVCVEAELHDAYQPLSGGSGKRDHTTETATSNDFSMFVTFVTLYSDVDELSFQYTMRPGTCAGNKYFINVRIRQRNDGKGCIGGTVGSRSLWNVCVVGSDWQHVRTSDTFQLDEMTLIDMNGKMGEVDVDTIELECQIK